MLQAPFQRGRQMVDDQNQEPKLVMLFGLELRCQNEISAQDVLDIYLMISVGCTLMFFSLFFTDKRCNTVLDEMNSRSVCQD